MGFHPGRPQGQGPSALVQCLDALDKAPAGAVFEVGLTWDPKSKWRVYQRLGNKMLVLSSDQARHLHGIYQRLRELPEYANVTDSVIEQLGLLGELANQCDTNNRSGVIPPGRLRFMPAKGSA